MTDLNNEQLAALKAAAEAADQDGQHIYTHWRDSNNYMANAAWQTAASPAAILALIAEVEAARRAHAAAPAPVATSDAGLIAAGALRQLRHNDGSEGFVAAYDKDITDREFARLRAALSTAPQAQAAQPPGTTNCYTCEGKGVLYKCVICASTEPGAGTCGSNDPRALCKSVANILAPASVPFAREEMVSCMLEASAVLAGEKAGRAPLADELEGFAMLVRDATPAAPVATSEQRKLAAAEFDRQFPPPTTDMRCDEYDALEAQRRVEWNAWWSAWQARTTSTSEATGG